MDLTLSLIVFGIILISMVIHEFAHGLVSYWLGDDTAKANGRLSLNPLKHLDPFLSIILPFMLFMLGGPIFGGAKPVPLDSRKLKGGEYGVALVALAGPLSNFILAFISFGVLMLLTSGSSFISQILAIAVSINLGFMIFNLIPIPPLDGSRILYSIAPEFIRDIMRRIEPYGFFVVMMFVVVFSTALAGFMQSVQSLIIELFMGIFRI